MRRINRPLLRKLLDTGAVWAEAEAQKGSSSITEVQAFARQLESKRWFSGSRLVQSAATEAKVNSINPYVLYGGVGAVGVGIVTYLMSSQPANSTIAPVITKAPALTTSEETSEYGSFDCLDHMGMHFTQDNLLGMFAVIFFGSMDSPGRRKRLLQMAEAVMESDRKSNMHYLTPVFATLTPEKDDVIRLNAMVEDYATALNRKDILHVRLKAITGDDNAKLHAAAQAYTHKVKGKDGVQSGSQATSHDEGDLYFVNPDGEFIASYGPNAEPKQIGKEFSDVMKAYKLSHPTWMGPKAVKTRHA